MDIDAIIESIYNNMHLGLKNLDADRFALAFHFLSDLRTELPANIYWEIGDDLNRHMDRSGMYYIADLYQMRILKK